MPLPRRESVSVKKCFGDITIFSILMLAYQASHVADLEQCGGRDALLEQERPGGEWYQNTIMSPSICDAFSTAAKNVHIPIEDELSLHIVNELEQGGGVAVEGYTANVVRNIIFKRKTPPAVLEPIKLGRALSKKEMRDFRHEVLAPVFAAFVTTEVLPDLFFESSGQRRVWKEVIASSSQPGKDVVFSKGPSAIKRDLQDPTTEVYKSFRKTPIVRNTAHDLAESVSEKDIQSIISAIRESYYNIERDESMWSAVKMSACHKFPPNAGQVYLEQLKLEEKARKENTERQKYAADMRQHVGRRHPYLRKGAHR